MKKIKFPSKVSFAPEPKQADELHLEKIVIDVHNETVVIHMRAIASDGGADPDGNPQPAVVEKRPIHMGLADYGVYVNVDKLEKETLDAVAASGRVPTGGNIE